MPQTKEDLIKRINNDFVYHPPFGDQVARYAAIREYDRQMAIQIVEDTPISREQSMALTFLEQAIFYANAAIREYGRQMAIQIVEDTPISREQSMALTFLEQAIFYANAAIARNEVPDEEDDDPTPADSPYGDPMRFVDR